VAATIGTAVLAFKAMSDASHELAQKAQELRVFAEVTGLSTTQVQALRAEASKFGITSDEMQVSIQHFTAQFDQLRNGEGELLKQVRRLNPELALQMQGTTDAAAALTLYGRALDQTNNIFQKNDLAKAGAGRGGIRTVNAFSGLDVQGVTQAYIAAGKALDENLIKKLTDLEIKINQTSGKMKQNISSIFAEDVLTAELKFYTTLKDTSEVAKNFGVSAGLLQLMKEFPSVVAAIPLIGPAAALLARLAPNLAPRVQPASSNPASLAAGALGNDGRPPAIAAGALTPEAQLANLKAIADAMGAAATPTQQLEIRMKALAIAAKEAGLSEGQLARAMGALQTEAAVSQLERNAAALGSSIKPAEELTVALAKLQQQYANGQISQEAFARGQRALVTDAGLKALQETVSALGSSATAAQQYAVRVAELQQKLEAGRISQETFNRAVLNANPAFAAVKDAAEQFTNGLVQGLLQGQGLMESLKSSAKSLASTLATSAVKDLINGDYVSAAIKGAVAIGAAIFGSGDPQKKQAVIQFAQEGLKRQAEFDDRRRAATRQDQNTVTGALQSFDQQADIQRRQEQAAGKGAMAQLEQALAAERLQVLKKFKDDALNVLKSDDPLSVVAQRMKEIEDAASTLTQALQESGESTAQVADMVAAATAKLRASFTDDLQRQINDVSGKSYLNDVADLLKQVSASRADAAQLGTGTDLIDRFFGVSAQKIVDQAGLVGDSFNDLIGQFPQLSGVVHAFTQDMTDYFTGTAKTINDYLNGLKIGSLSTLSPEQQLAAARSQFQSQLGLAQGGDRDALGSITQTADALLNVAKSFFASSAGYAQIYDLVNSSLSQLSAGLGGGATALTAGPVSFGALATIPSAPVSFAAPSSASGSANDNRANFAELASVNASGFNAVVSKVADLIEKVDEASAMIADVLRTEASRPRRPGKSVAA
jgi:hypothetical protein